MTWWQILVIVLPIWIIYFQAKKFFNHRKAIGLRVTIDYYAQNRDFEKIFPKKGEIRGTIKIGRQKLFLLDLDDPFTYKNSDFKNIAIRERLFTDYIGENDEVQVHVFLPKTRLDKDQYKIEDFHHVAWATVTPD